MEQSMKKSSTGKPLLRYATNWKTWEHDRRSTRIRDTFCQLIASKEDRLGREPPLREGEFKIERIKEFIKKQGLAREGWISKDDTKIKTAVRYNPNSYTIMGLELPVNIQ